MPNVMIYLDPVLSLDPDAVARAWTDDDEAAILLAGYPQVEVDRKHYGFDVVNVIVLPLAVNLASDVLVLLVAKMVSKVRRGEATSVAAKLLESEGEDRIVAVTEQTSDRAGCDDNRDRGKMA